MSVIYLGPDTPGPGQYRFALISLRVANVNLRHHAIGLRVDPGQTHLAAVSVADPHRPGTKRDRGWRGWGGDRGNHTIGLLVNPVHQVLFGVHSPDRLRTDIQWTDLARRQGDGRHN